MRKSLHHCLQSACLMGLLWLAWLLPAHAADDRQPLKVVVSTVAVVDLHAGPGRGFPRFALAQRGESLVFSKRQTDWFEVSNERGQVGWVPRDVVETLLADPAIDDSLRRRILGRWSGHDFEAGFAAGQIDDDPVVAIRLGYWFSDELNLELGISQASGTYTNSRLYSATVQLSPWGRARFSPYFGLGYGFFENDDRDSLVGGGTEDAVDTIETDVSLYGFGLRYRWGEHLVLRADFRQSLVLTDSERYDDFAELLAGLSFTF